MSPNTAILIVHLLELILAKGVPAYIEWQDGVYLNNPTAEDFEKLKVEYLEEA